MDICLIAAWWATLSTYDALRERSGFANANEVSPSYRPRWRSSFWRGPPDWVGQHGRLIWFYCDRWVLHGLIQCYHLSKAVPSCNRMYTDHNLLTAWNSLSQLVSGKKWEIWTDHKNKCPLRKLSQIETKDWSDNSVVCSEKTWAITILSMNKDVPSPLTNLPPIWRGLDRSIFSPIQLIAMSEAHKGYYIPDPSVKALTEVELKTCCHP